MGLRDVLQTGLAKQLGHPSGLRGRWVGSMLNNRNGRAVSAAIDLLDIQDGETAADFGFGGGFGLVVLLGKVGERGTVHGVDISETMLAKATKLHRTDGRFHAHAGSVTELPLPDNSVDAAITVNTIYFVEDLGRAFAEIARVLAPGGRVVIGIGDPDAMSENPVTQHGFRLRPVADVVSALTTAGLTLEEDKLLDSSPHTVHLLVARPTPETP
jgi:SAM-dependent methyltransferase